MGMYDDKDWLKANSVSVLLFQNKHHDLKL